MKRLILFVLFVLLFSSLASAVEWSPQGNANLKNRYYILNNPAGTCSGTNFSQGYNSTGHLICIVPAGGGTSNFPYEGINETVFANQSPNIGIHLSFWDSLYLRITDYVSRGYNSTTMELDSDGNFSVKKLWLDGIYVKITYLVSNYYNKTTSNSLFNESLQIDALNASKSGIGDCPSGKVVQNLTTGAPECLPMVNDTDTHWGYNATTMEVDGDGNLSVNIVYFDGRYFKIVNGINWTALKNYPAACPTGYAITQLNDSVTCTAFPDTHWGYNTTTMEVDGEGNISVKYSWLEGIFVKLSYLVSQYYNKTTSNNLFNNTPQIDALNLSKSGIGDCPGGKVIQNLTTGAPQCVPMVNDTDTNCNASGSCVGGGVAYMNFSNNGVFTATEFSGAQNWTDNQNYPAACPAGTATTKLDDSITCTSFGSMSSWNTSNGSVDSEITDGEILYFRAGENMDIGFDGDNFTFKSSYVDTTNVVQSWHICEYGSKYGDITLITNDYNLMFGHTSKNSMMDGYSGATCIMQENFTSSTIGYANMKMRFDISVDSRTLIQGGEIILGNVWYPFKVPDAIQVLNYSNNLTYAVRMRLKDNLTWSGSLNNVTMFANDGENMSKFDNKVINLTDKWQWFVLPVFADKWSDSRRWGIHILHGQTMYPFPDIGYSETFYIEWEQAVIYQ